MKIAVFLPNWIGDAVMATPALRALRTKYADAQIVAVLRPYVAEVLDGLDLVDEQIAYDPRGAEPQDRGWPLVQRLRREQFDMALLLPNSLRSAWIAWLSGAKRRVGFARDGRSWLLTDRVSPKSKKVPHPVIDEYLRLAQHLGCEIDRDGLPSRTLELATTAGDERSLSQFWNHQDQDLRGRGVVCLNPGGAFGAAKHWPTDSFGELANRLANEMGKVVLVLCGPAERDEARKIVARAAHPAVVSLADTPPGLGLTKAAIRHAELLVTTDSGPRHFAAPFGVPVVTLFGPTHIVWSETYSANAVHLQIPVDCGPCQQRVCPVGHHRCMRDLTVDQVFHAACSLLNAFGTHAAA